MEAWHTSSPWCGLGKGRHTMKQPLQVVGFGAPLRETEWETGRSGPQSIGKFSYACPTSVNGNHTRVLHHHYPEVELGSISKNMKGKTNALKTDQRGSACCNVFLAANLRPCPQVCLLLWGALWSKELVFKGKSDYACHYKLLLPLPMGQDRFQYF